MTLDELNALPQEAMVAALDGVFEHAPWVAARASGMRPFATVAALHEAMMGAVRAAPEAEQLAFLRGHPELGGAAARGGMMAAHSVAEQRALGLDTLADARSAEIQQLNAEYGARFGFPFILCVTRHTRPSILAEFRRRLAAPPEVERRTAMDEIGLITRLRLAALVEGPGRPTVEGRLSTHVLDTVAGRPASGVPVSLFVLDGAEAAAVTATVTNADGRTDAPLLGGGPLRMGTYELRFDLGGYFGPGGRGFLEVIPIRFGIIQAEAHYHVPLLVSPFSYSTYLGS